MAGNDNLIADTICLFAVAAATGDGARSIPQEALLVGRCCHRSGPGDGILQGIHNLVHPGNHDDLFGAIANSCYPVSGSVDIHHLTIQADSIGTGKEAITAKPFSGDTLQLFRGGAGTSVQCRVIPLLDGVRQSNLLSGHGTAPADTGAFRNQLQGFFQCLFLVFAVISFKMAVLQILNQNFSTLFVIGFHGVCHHLHFPFNTFP